MEPNPSLDLNKKHRLLTQSKLIKCVPMGQLTVCIDRTLFSGPCMKVSIVSESNNGW